MISNIADSEQGNSVRAKLNQLIYEVNTGISANSIAFNQAIPFTHSHAMMYKMVNGALTFTIDSNNARIGNGTELVLIADGVNVPDFSAFKKLGSSQNYLNILGQENNVIFYLNAAGHYVYSISVGSLYDITPPTVISADSITTTTVLLTFSENVTVDVSGWSFKKNGSNLPIVSVSGSGSNWTFTTNSFLLTDTLVVSYDATTGGTQDAFANALATISNAAVNNSGGVSALNWINANAVTPGVNGSINGGSPSGIGDGCIANKKIAGNGYVTFEFDVTPSNSEPIALVFSAVNNTNYNWNGGNTFLAAIFRNAGNIFWMNDFSTFAMLVAGTGITHIRLQRSGNDCLWKTSTDGINFTTQRTTTNLFSGVGDLYVKAIFSSNAATQKIASAKGFGLS
jgi:hypothetical protein